MTMPRPAGPADTRDADAAWVRESVIPLVQDGEAIERMSAAAASVGVRDGHLRLADLVERAVGQ